MTGYVYRAFDAHGVLLYVGTSAQPSQRFSQHKRDSDWWFEVRTITLEVFPTPEDARAAETVAIRIEAPRYNISCPGGAPDLEGARRRREGREAVQRERDNSYFVPPGGVTCRNCGLMPSSLPKGQLLGETPCPRCECTGTLDLVPGGDA